MKKETIAVDIDDVLVETAPYIVNQMQNRYGTVMTLEDFYSPDPKTWGVNTIQEAMTRVNSIVETKEYLQLPPVGESITALRGIQRSYRLAIITSRLSTIEESTRVWLERHYPDLFSHVQFISTFDPGNEQPLSKAHVCQELQAEYLIDDNLSHILEATQFGVKGMLFGNYPWNQALSLPDNVVRVENWEVAEAYLNEKG